MSPPDHPRDLTALSSYLPSPLLDLLSMSSITPESRHRIAHTLQRTARFLRLTPPGRALLKDLNYDLTTLLVALSEEDPTHPVLDQVLAEREEVLQQDHNHQGGKKWKMPGMNRHPARSTMPDEAPQNDSAPPPHQRPRPPTAPGDTTRKPGRKRHPRPQAPQFTWKKGLLTFIQETIQYEIWKQGHVERKAAHHRRRRGRKRHSPDGDDAVEDAGGASDPDDDTSPTDVTADDANQNATTTTRSLRSDRVPDERNASDARQVRPCLSPHHTARWAALGRPVSRPESLMSMDGRSGAGGDVVGGEKRFGFPG